MEDHSKITKMHFGLIERANNVFFGHFIEFGWFDWPILHVMREENPRLSEVFQVSKGFLTLFKVFQGLTLSPLFTALQFSTLVEVRLGNSQLQLRSGLGMLVY